mgnify:FL=1
MQSIDYELHFILKSYIFNLNNMLASLIIKKRDAASSKKRCFQLRTQSTFIPKHYQGVTSDFGSSSHLVVKSIKSTDNQDYNL